MADVIKHQYSNTLSFNHNRNLQELGKLTTELFQANLEYFKAFPADSVIQIYAAIFQSCLEFLDAGWVSLFRYDLNIEDSALQIPNVKMECFSKWRNFLDETLPEDLFLTVETKTTNVIPILLESEGDKVKQWATTWVEKNPELVWSYSYMTFTVLMWVTDNTRCEILEQSENKIHIKGYYQAGGGREFETIEVILDNQVALDTMAFTEARAKDSSND